MELSNSSPPTRGGVFLPECYKDAEKIIKHAELKKTLLRAFALLKYEKLQEKSLIKSGGGNK